MEYKVTSFSESADGKHAQITVTVGEGRNRRSFTRHLEYRGGWVGLNIDERAVPLNERYEQELDEAKNELSNAKSSLKNLRDEFMKMEAETPENIDEVAMLKEIKTELTETITGAELRFYAAEAIVDDAEAKLDIIRRELPLMMQFDRN